jgi:phage portal protein BeeE
VGVLQNFKTALGYGPRLDYLASPFSEGQLQKIAFAEIFGENYAPITRADAMSIPALSKARNLIAGTIAKLPLTVKDANGVLALEAQPEWTYRTTGPVSPFLRMLWTLDDLLFYGHALWEVDRDSDGNILTAERVRYDWWSITPEGAILVHDQSVDANDVIYFPGPIEGILDKDAQSLRSAHAVAAAVAHRTSSPIPVMEIHATGDGDGVTEEEAKALVAGYNKARRDPEGATVFTPASVELKPHGDKSDAGFMIEGRNAVRLDIANLTGVPAALLDGSVSQSSLTYSTQEGRRNEFVDYGLSIWMEAVAGRLSADDVVPSGQHVVFDQTDFLTTIPSPTGAEKQD